MRGLLERIITEPGAGSARQFARRVRLLAVTYSVLFAASLAGVVLVAWQGKLFVTLAQRSNVETLTVLFLLVFYAYLAALSAPGAVGALRIAALRFHLPSLGPVGEGPTAALDLAVASDGPLRFPLCGGDLGAVIVDGVRVTHVEARAGGSADVLAYFVRQLSEVLRRELTVVEWGQLSDDGTARYLAQVEFARNLGKKLGEPLWPQVWVTREQRAEVQERLDAVGDALIEDALLPDWEYGAEHKLPVIPEPLGLVSLNRSAKRADPLATMGFALLIVLLSLGTVILFILRPPWVPG